MKRQPKPIPPGPPLNTPDEELDLMALVSLSDIEDAKAAGRQRGPARGKALLESTRVELPPEDNAALPLGS